MKKILVLMAALLALSVAGQAASLCTGNANLQALITTGTCYIAGGSGQSDTWFTNFVYTPTGTAVAASGVSVNVDGNAGLNQDIAGFIFTGNWDTSSTMTITFTSNVCTATDVTNGNCVLAVATSNFLGAKATEVSPFFGNATMTNSWNGNSVNTTAAAFGQVGFGNPSGLSSGGWSLTYNGNGNNGIVSIEADTFQQTYYIPEPMTMVLAGGGLLAVGLLARKRRKA